MPDQVRHSKGIRRGQLQKSRWHRRAVSREYFVRGGTKF